MTGPSVPCGKPSGLSRGPAVLGERLGLGRQATCMGGNTLQPMTPTVCQTWGRTPLPELSAGRRVHASQCLRAAGSSRSSVSARSPFPGIGALAFSFLSHHISKAYFF